jgi:hypothetical protein
MRFFDSGFVNIFDLFGCTFLDNIFPTLLFTLFNLTVRMNFRTLFRNAQPFFRLFFTEPGHSFRKHCASAGPLFRRQSTHRSAAEGELLVTAVGH